MLVHANISKAFLVTNMKKARVRMKNPNGPPPKRAAAAKAKPSIQGKGQS